MAVTDPTPRLGQRRRVEITDETETFVVDVTDSPPASDAAGLVVRVVSAPAGGDNVTVLDIEDGTGDSVMDAANDAIKVNVVAGGTSGTQYTEGDTDASVTGNAVMWEDAADTLRVASAAKPLPVNVVAGGAGDGSILDGVTSSIKATVLDLTSANPLTVGIVDGNGDQITSFGGGTQYTEGDTDASITGTALMWEDAADTLVAASAAKPLPVSDAGGSLTVDNAGLTELAAAIDTEVQVDVVGALPAGDANIGNVDIVTVPAPLSTTGGGTEATALRVTVATDSTGVLSVDDNGGTLTVDGTVDLGATDNAVLDAIAASVAAIDIDTDDLASLAVVGGGVQATALRVTVASDSTGVLSVDDNGSTLSVDDGAGTLTIDNPVLSVVGSGTEAAAQRVTIATDSTGVLSVDDNGGTLTVDNPILSVVGGGTEATAQRVTIASDSTGVLSVDDNGGTLTVDGTVAVSLADVVGSVADDGTTPGDPVMVGGWAISPDGTTPGAVAEADVARFRTDLNRRLLINDEHPGWWSFHSNGSTALTDQSVAADPGDGFQLVITDIQFSNGSTSAMNMFLEEGSTTIWGPVYLEAINGRGYVWKGKKHVTASTALTVTTSAAAAHSVEILGYIQAV